MNIRETKEFKLAEGFIMRNARPLDLAMWRYLFRGGSREDVLCALAAFQNPDGGFGWGLECDCLNPHSSPIQTLTAVGALGEIGLGDGSHPIIQGILRYLDSGADFDENAGEWLTTVPTNNDFPHAVWWSFVPGMKPEQNPLRYNPTAALAGFILRFADRNSPLYRKGEKIAQSAVEYLTVGNCPAETHVTGCFAMMYEQLLQAGEQPEYMDSLKTALLSRAENEICRDPGRWQTEYVPKPSDYIKDRTSLFYKGSEELCTKECELIRSGQLEDGSFPVTWDWCTDYREFALAANWWKARFIITNMRFLAEFGE